MTRLLTRNGGSEKPPLVAGSFWSELARILTVAKGVASNNWQKSASGGLYARRPITPPGSTRRLAAKFCNGDSLALWDDVSDPLPVKRPRDRANAGVPRE